MRMNGRIVVLALAIGFFAAPSLGAAAMDSCPPCCPQAADAPCETGEAPCVSLSAISCCDVAAAALASQAKRSIDAPTLHRATHAVRASAPISQHVQALRIAGDLALLTSPLRLSVVLLI